LCKYISFRNLRQKQKPFLPQDNSSFYVYAGAHDLLSLESERKYSYISKIIPHPNYNKTSLENDIVLLKLSAPLDTSISDRNINAICLPKLGQSFEGIVTASGWRNTHNSQGSGQLITVELPLINIEQCRSLNFDYFHMIKNTMICAGYRIGGNDTCIGDSGSPLVQKINDKSTLVGIVSWEIGCVFRRNPGVYTDVSYYIDWINSTL